MLGQIFGSKDVSRAVAQNAASQTGLEPSLLKKMLPILAMLVAGYMAKQRAGAVARPSGEGGGGLLDSVLRGRAGGTGNDPSPGAGGGLASMLDLNRDGNVLDDIMRMAGRTMR